MIQKYRPGAGVDEIAAGADVRFGEFVRDILAHQEKSPDNLTATVGFIGVSSDL